MAKSVEALQQSLQTEIENYKSKHKEYKKLQGKRAQLDAQLNELDAVKSEFNLLKEDAEVYKLVGPILIKQEHVEAKETVNKRISFINGELKRTDDSVVAIEKTLAEQREKLNDFQKRIQEASAQ